MNRITNKQKLKFTRCFRTLKMRNKHMKILLTYNTYFLFERYVNNEEGD